MRNVTNIQKIFTPKPSTLRLVGTQDVIVVKCIPEFKETETLDCHEFRSLAPGLLTCDMEPSIRNLSRLSPFLQAVYKGPTCLFVVQQISNEAKRIVSPKDGVCVPAFQSRA